MASFGSLSIGVSGIYASQKALETISHNISNANNPEYTRQRVDFIEAGLKNSGQFQVGTGTDVSTIKQIRDEFLDNKLRGQVSKYSYWGQRNNIMSRIESIIGETGEIDDKVTGGLAKTMDDFWKSMEQLAKDPSNLTVRGVFKERAEGFVTTVRHMYYQLDTLQQNLNTTVKDIVDETNKISTQIADLNKEIVSKEAAGVSANDYRDKRNGLIDRLSQIIDISVNEDSKGNVAISMSGTHIVSESSSKNLEYRGNTEGPLVDVYWEDGSTPIELGRDKKGGELLAVLEARGSADGVTANGKELENIIPAMKKKLNELVSTIAKAINNQQMDGYTLDGVKAGPSSGIVEVVEGKKQMISFGKGDAENADKLDIQYAFSGSNSEPVISLSGNNTLTITLGNREENNTVKKIQEALRDYDLSSVGVDETQIIVDGDDIGKITSDTELKSDAKSPNKIEIISFFSSENGKPIDASNIQLNLKGLNDIAASSSFDSNGDGKNAEAIVSLRDSLLYSGDKLTISDFYGDVITDFGISAEEARNMMETQGRIITELDNKKQSISAVSLDEEMSDMLKFQHAYSSSTRFINAIDEMLDLIINRMAV